MKFFFGHTGFEIIGKTYLNVTLINHQGIEGTGEAIEEAEGVLRALNTEICVIQVSGTI